MGGRPSALPTAAIAGCSSVCVSLPVWLLSKVANFSSTYAFQDLSFSTNAFSDFPSMNALVVAIALVPFLRRARALSLSVCLARSLARSLSHSSFEIRPSQKKKSTKFTESKQNNPFLEKPKLQCPRTSSSLFLFFFFSSSSSFKQNSSQRLANNAGKFLGLNKQETGKNDLGTETSEVLTWGQKAQKF